MSVEVSLEISLDVRTIILRNIRRLEREQIPIEQRVLTEFVRTTEAASISILILSYKASENSLAIRDRDNKRLFLNDENC